MIVVSFLALIAGALFTIIEDWKRQNEYENDSMRRIKDACYRSSRSDAEAYLIENDLINNRSIYVRDMKQSNTSKWVIEYVKTTYPSAVNEWAFSFEEYYYDYINFSNVIDANQVIHQVVTFDCKDLVERKEMILGDVSEYFIMNTYSDAWEVLYPSLVAIDEYSFFFKSWVNGRIESIDR